MVGAPFLGLLVAFWAFGNRQMFSNKIDRLTSQDDVILSHHLITGNHETFSHQQTLWSGTIVISCVYLVYTVLSLGWDYNLKIRLSEKPRIMPSFFSVLKIEDAKQMLEEERFFR